MVGLLDDVETHADAVVARRRATSIVLLGRTREELGGSEYLAVVHRLVPRHAAVDRSRGREAPAPRGARRRRTSGCCARRTTSPRAGSRWRSPSAASAGPRLGARVALERGMRRRRAAVRREPVAHAGVACGAQHLDPPARARAARGRAAARCSARCAGRAWSSTDMFELPVETARERWRRVARATPRLVTRAVAGLPGRGRSDRLGGSGTPMTDKFHEECGVVGVFGHPEAANLAYLGLYALQHRGQESAGIVVVERRGADRAPRHGPGRRHLRPGHPRAASRGASAIGHNRYSTHGLDRPEERQPFVVEWAQRRARRRPQRQPGERRGAARAARGARLDLPVDVRHRGDHPPDRRVAGGHADRPRSSTRWRQVRGAYSLVFLDRGPASSRRAIRTASGRWCSGRVGDAVGGHVRDLRARSGRRRRTSARSSRARSSSSRARGPRVGATRSPPARGAPLRLRVRLLRASRQPGLRPQRLPGAQGARPPAGARDAASPADIVIPVPDSGVPAAIGYAEEAGHPLRDGPDPQPLRRAHLHRAARTRSGTSASR